MTALPLHLVLVLALVAATPAISETVVGTTVIGGKRVELLSDNTWRYRDTADLPATCQAITPEVSFCGTILDWRPRPVMGTELDALFASSLGQVYSGILHENLGRRDGLTGDGFREIIIDNVASTSGERVENVPILSVDDTIKVDDHPAETLAYTAKVYGIRMTYLNTWLVEEGDSLQVLSWTAGTEVSEALADRHAAFVRSIRLSLAVREDL